MHLVIQLLGRDRVYALENPGYRKLYQIFAANGVTVRPTPLDKHGLRADALTASDASVVYLTPSHHFPLGAVMTLPADWKSSAGVGSARPLHHRG